MTNNDCYMGNPLVKADGVTHNFTQKEVDEYVKCSKSPVYFATNYMKIINLDRGLVPFEPYSYQRKLLRHMNKNRFSVILACRQSGKCQHLNTNIKIRHKETHYEENITIGEFHKRIEESLQHNKEPNEPEIQITAPVMGYTRAGDSKLIRQYLPKILKQTAKPEDNTLIGRARTLRSIHCTTRLSDTIERKFTESFRVSDYLVWTDTGWEPIVASNKTIPYRLWTITLDNGLSIICADTHILMTPAGLEVFAKDSKGVTIHTENGPSKVCSVIEENTEESMYDLSINSINHTYYANGILSHNSISAVTYLLWVALFQPEQTIAILANKASVAKEMLSRITLALENIPFFLQPGCKALNKLSVEFSNNSRIFASSTSSSSIRGYACVTADTVVTLCNDDDEIYHTSIEALQTSLDINSPMQYIIYRITNIVNQKVYVGFHGTRNINDGYMGSGKLIKRAIEKYGVNNFTKEVLEIYTDKDEAIAREREIINEEFILRDDTYNLSLGGNVLALPGRMNPFFGCTHTEASRKLIGDAHRGHISPGRTAAFIDGEIVTGWKDIGERLNLKSPRVTFPKIAGDPTNEIRFVDDFEQEAAEKMFFASQNKIDGRKESSLKGKRKSVEHCRAISRGLSGLSKSKEHVRKINNSAEKIRKTAAALRGQKRTAESKKKMSLAKIGRTPSNRGKMHFYNPVNTIESGYYLIDDAPSGWVRGISKCKS